MTRKPSSWVSHMTLRQLILLVASVSAVLALIFVDGRSTDAQIDEVEETKQEVAMPHVSAANMLATSWFCPGVPGNDDGINFKLFAFTECHDSSTRRGWCMTLDSHTRTNINVLFLERLHVFCISISIFYLFLKDGLNHTQHHRF